MAATRPPGLDQVGAKLGVAAHEHGHVVVAVGDDDCPPHAHGQRAESAERHELLLGGDVTERGLRVAMLVGAILGLAAEGELDHLVDVPQVLERGSVDSADDLLACHEDANYRSGVRRIAEGPE